MNLPVVHPLHCVPPAEFKARLDAALIAWWHEQPGATKCQYDWIFFELIDKATPGVFNIPLYRMRALPRPFKAVP